MRRPGRSPAAARPAFIAAVRELDWPEVYQPIDRGQPDLTVEDGLIDPPVELHLTLRQKLARLAVIMLFIVVGAAFGAALV